MRLKIVLLGMMGRCPVGGQAWIYLNWLRAFSRLGHDVYYIEDDPSWPYDPTTNCVTDDCTYAVRHVRSCLERCGLEGKWAYRLPDRSPAATWGMESQQIDELYRSCDILVNLQGGSDLREEHMRAARRVYIQTDPVTCELRLANGDEHTREHFAAHDIIFTYGENYGAADCDVPLNGIEYHKTRQPIDLELWPYEFDPSAAHFTTIGNYRQTGSDVDYNGQTYRWSKHYEWEKVIDLPRRTKQTFELAVMPEDEADRLYLREHGWRLTSPLEMSLDVFGKYPGFIQQSRGEFTVAKDQNVRLRSGWFSDRSACYLAAGRPVITQETGFSNHLPTGKGLFGFAGLEDILTAVDRIESDYPGNCRAARE